MIDIILVVFLFVLLITTIAIIAPILMYIWAEAIWMCKDLFGKR